MTLAINEALKARRAGDYAIGAVIVRGNKVIARGLNSVRIRHDSTQHAEMVAMQTACRRMRRRFLTGCILYTTHAPCAMCAAAAVWCKLKGIVSGTTLHDMQDFARRKGDNRFTWRTINLSAKEVLLRGNPKVQLVEKFMRKECLALFHSS